MEIPVPLLRWMFASMGIPRYWERREPGTRGDVGTHSVFRQTAKRHSF